MIHRYEIGDLAHTHIGDTASLALMLEKGKIFYQNYAKHVVDNAKALAGTMIENGLTVYFQSSHQVWIDCGNINITEAINECF
ncbi:hypothetical protein QA584_26345 [Anaerocolumna sp. AGMB13025]|uniref:hypothetical protein n=1 Tax=Anaerocolumna sp. AGMB13025 TaxID=3039116 RepID=UPI00241C0FD3|nr:hypothetical protein [Anaerocolumna sp. AGMB13025]WFR57092.1 hypothetical protein QA584_26345 [Anaerocolumna sp. AGMB13025]